MFFPLLFFRLLIFFEKKGKFVEIARIINIQNDLKNTQRQIKQIDNEDKNTVVNTEFEIKNLLYETNHMIDISI